MLNVSFGFLTYGLILLAAFGCGLSKKFPKCGDGGNCKRLNKCKPLMYILESEELKIMHKKKEEILQDRQCGKNKYCCPNRGHQEFKKQCMPLEKCIAMSCQTVTTDFLKSSINHICSIQLSEKYFKKRVHVYCEKDCQPNGRCFPWNQCHKNVTNSMPNRPRPSPDNKRMTIGTRSTRGNVLPSSCGASVPSLFKWKFNPEVTPNAFPWMAMLIYENTSGSAASPNSKSECGGSLINTRYVVTAAHCVVNSDIIDEDMVLKRVRLGEHDIHTNPDCRQGRCSAPYVEINVEYFEVHKLYSNRRRFENDIALVRLGEPVRYTKEIQPICLLKDPIELKKRILFIAGWGLTEDGVYSSVLRHTAVYENITYCKKDLGLYQPESQICAGNKYGDDACSGDSGGPMMVSLSHGGERSMYLAGIISYGPKMCGKGNSGFYTLAGVFFKWIKSKLKP